MSADAPSVATPSPAITSEVVERALAEAEQLLVTSGAASSVDRIHTAFHAYLLAVCAKAGLSLSGSGSITTMFKLLRSEHPAFKEQGPRAGDIEQVVKVLASVVSVLNPLRNMASMAHPNSLLAEPEAMLVINSVKTLLHYINAKTRDYSGPGSAPEREG